MSSEKTIKQQSELLPYAFMFFAASLLITGYRVYFHNQALQIPLIHLLNDPTLYPRDPFAATLPYYASFTWRLAAWCARIVPLEPLLLVFYLIERFMAIYAAGNLARVLAPKSRFAVTGAMAFFAMNPTPIIGGGTLVMPYFEQTGLAVGFFLFAMAAFYSKRPIAWALWLAAGFNCNSMYGVYALTYFGAAFILDPDYRRDMKRWLIPLGLFAILALPSVILSAAVMRQGHVDKALWFAAARARIPHHIFPSIWPTIKFTRFAVFLAVSVIVSALRLRTSGAWLSRHSLIWAGVGVTWVAFAIIAEAVHSPAMMILQPARSTDLWYSFGVVALLAAACVAAEDNPRQRIFIAFALVPWFVFWPGSHMGWYLLAGFAVLAWNPIWSRISKGGSQIWAVRLVIVLVFISAVFALNDRVENMDGLKPALYASPGCSMRQICDWAMNHTSRETTFLIDPTWGEFRGLSRRPAFVTWKDGSALLWNRPFAAPWVERLQALGCNIITLKIPSSQFDRLLQNRYDSMTDSDALRLAHRYNLQFWIVKSDHESHLPTVFRNHYFKILKLG